MLTFPSFTNNVIGFILYNQEFHDAYSLTPSAAASTACVAQPFDMTTSWCGSVSRARSSPFLPSPKVPPLYKFTCNASVWHIETCIKLLGTSLNDYLLLEYSIMKIELNYIMNIYSILSYYVRTWIFFSVRKSTNQSVIFIKFSRVFC